MFDFFKKALFGKSDGKKSDERSASMKTGTTDKSVLGVAAETVLRIQTDLFDLGQSRALASNDTVYRQDVADSLSGHAEAMAKEQTAALYDVLNSRHDAELEEQVVTNKKHLAETEEKISAATDKVNMCRDGLANRGQKPVKIQEPVFLILFFSLTIAASLFATFLDYVFGNVTDRNTAVAASFGASIVLGLALSWALAGGFKSSHGGPHLVGLIGGIGIGFAFLFVRLYAVEEPGSMFLSVGYTVLELGSVLILEHHGRGLAKQYAAFLIADDDYHQAAKRFASAETERDGLLADRSRLEAKVEAFVQHVREREHLARQLDNLVNSARKAVLDGYRAGLAENEGRVRGRKNRKG